MKYTVDEALLDKVADEADGDTLVVLNALCDALLEERSLVESYRAANETLEQKLKALGAAPAARTLQIIAPSDGTMH